MQVVPFNRTLMYYYWQYMSCWAAATFWNPPSYIAWLAPAVPIPIAACLRGCCPWGCMRAWTPPILLIASCRSQAKRSVAERPGKGAAAAGGGSGFEIVPGGVGLLPQEHYMHKNNMSSTINVQTQKVETLGQHTCITKREREPSTVLYYFQLPEIHNSNNKQRTTPLFVYHTKLTEYFPFEQPELPQHGY